MKFRQCVWCKKEIPQERLEVLPDTDTCVKCSREGKKFSTVIGTGSGKGYVLQIFDHNDQLARSFIAQRAIRVL